MYINVLHSRFISGVTMREKKGGALQKLKKRLSHSFGRLSEYRVIDKCKRFFFSFAKSALSTLSTHHKIFINFSPKKKESKNWKQKLNYNKSATKANHKWATKNKRKQSTEKKIKIYIK